jgi:hypothetical protein
MSRSRPMGPRFTGPQRNSERFCSSLSRHSLSKSVTMAMSPHLAQPFLDDNHWIGNGTAIAAEEIFNLRQ